MAVNVVSFSFSRAAQPEAQGPALCWMMAFFTASYHQLVWSPNFIGGPQGPFGRVWLSLPHIVSDVSDPQLYQGPQLIKGSKGSLRRAFSTTSYQQPLWTPTHQELQGPPPPGFLYHILSATSLDPNSIGGPENSFGLVWLSLPYDTDHDKPETISMSPIIGINNFHKETGLILPAALNIDSPNFTKPGMASTCTQNRSHARETPTKNTSTPQVQNMKTCPKSLNYRYAQSLDKPPICGIPDLWLEF